MNRKNILSVLFFVLLNFGSFAQASQNDERRSPLADRDVNTGSISPAPSTPDSTLSGDSVGRNDIAISVEQIQTVLLSYNLSIDDQVEQPLIDVFQGMNNDVIHYYMEFALRLCNCTSGADDQATLVNIILSFKKVDEHACDALSRVFCLVSDAVYEEDETPGELLYMITTRPEETRNGEFFERLAYLEKLPNDSEYLNFQFISNTMWTDIEKVREAMRDILSNLDSAGE